MSSCPCSSRTSGGESSNSTVSTFTLFANFPGDGPPIGGPPGGVPPGGAPPGGVPPGGVPPGGVPPGGAPPGGVPPGGVPPDGVPPGGVPPGFALILTSILLDSEYLPLLEIPWAVTLNVPSFMYL